MAQQPRTVDATFYAVVTPIWAPAWMGEDDQGRRVLEGAKVERITQKRPGTVSGGAVVTRLTIRLDSTALLPLAPQAVIHVSAGQVEVIEAEATDPREGEDGVTS